MKIQHLVLDDDVHKTLKARKETIGITVKEIGNSALRAALAIPTMENLIVEKLVETGKISRKDYDQAVTAADKAIKAAHKRAAEALVHDSSRQTWIIGSWEGEEMYRSPDDQIQILGLRAHDGRRIPTPVLVHDESHVWATVLSGKLRLQIGTEEEVMGPHEMIHVRPGTPHASTPLTRAARVVLVLMPAVALRHEGA